MWRHWLWLLFSRQVLSDSLWPHGLQHTRLLCLHLSPRVSSNSCPLNWWCSLITTSCCPLLLPPSIFPSIRVFSNESSLCNRWPKYWSFSFSISPSNEYWGLIFFRMDWFDLLAVHGTFKSLLQHHNSKKSILQHSTFFMWSTHWTLTKENSHLRWTHEQKFKKQEETHQHKRQPVIQ